MPPKTAGKISGIWMYFPEKRQDILPVRCAAPMHATRAGWRVLAGGGVAIRLPPGARCHRKPLTITAVSRMMKLWCRAIDLPGTYGAHFLRKIFGHIRRAPWGVGLARIRKAFSPFSPRATMGHWGRGVPQCRPTKWGRHVRGAAQCAAPEPKYAKAFQESRPPLFGALMADSGIQEGMAQAVSPFRRRTPC